MAFVQQLFSANGASASSVAVVPTANTALGNFLILVISAGSNADVTSVTDTQSNTWDIDVQSDGARQTAIVTCEMTTALTTADTITVNLSPSGANAIVLAEFSGIAASPLDKFNSRNQSAVTTGNTQSTGTLTQADELVICTIGWSGSTGTISSAPSGYTALTSPTAAFQALYKDVSTTTALDESWAWATSRNYGACIATYKYPIVSTFKPRVVFM